MRGNLKGKPVADYALYYWPVPFRGQPIRAVLAHAGATWDEFDPAAVAALKDRPLAGQPVPHMGPPVLIDHAAGVALSQMPAILGYLGVRHGLVPDDAAGRALTDKITGDADDVFNDMTRHNGALIRLAFSVQAILVFVTFTATGFDAQAATQPIAAQWGLRFLLGGTPALAALVTVFALTRFPLHGEALTAMRETLGSRNSHD